VFEHVQRGLIVLIILMGTKPTQASNSTWWHNLSQTTRNALIVLSACEDLGENTGLSCKEWVRDVVEEASSQSAIIPSTKPNLYQWYAHPYVTATSASTSIQNASTGSIIQMKWSLPSGGSTPHTAIIVAHASNGMWWIDCNWNFDTKVTIHFVSYSLFYQRAGALYTVHYIK